MSLVAVELVIVIIATVVALIVGRHYTYNHPMAKQMQEKRERERHASAPTDDSATE
jgi:hypothetical protein